MEYVTLENGVNMPILGYGVYQVTREECERCVSDALQVGYRSIDTAQSYFNEEEV
ncbi:MAG: aldo/keto reductase, partial [Eubacteriales bacterium]